MTPPIIHTISREQNELGRFRATCSCGWKQKATTSDTTLVRKAGESHERSVRAAAERRGAA
jgi:hypothetical protein